MNNCEDLYREYREIEAITHIEAQALKRGQSYVAQYIKPDDLIKRKSLAKELVLNCELYFKNKPDEWFDLKEEILN